MVLHPRFLDPFMARQENPQEMVDERRARTHDPADMTELGNPTAVLRPGLGLRHGAGTTRCSSFTA